MNIFLCIVRSKPLVPGSSGTAPQKVCFVHGDDHAATELAHKTRDRYGVKTIVPEFGEKVEVE
ncbi:MAG: hypothetical protein UV18_C0007G0059 [Candidatus Magasanikbacteria bacterium GW2011_GWC2_42_27]|nr:MAG: hypothetical protein UV18_C0007G0059 [Candidatus Magasanikbacteria bacterium GW2011_GWC2_42_27]